MATAQIIQGNDTVEVEIFIAAPPTRVFQAISDPSQTSQWWGQKGLYRVTKAEADVRVGGEWRSSGIGDDGKEFSVGGKYLEVNPPRLLVHTWNPSISSCLRLWCVGKSSPRRYTDYIVAAPPKLAPVLESAFDTP